MTQKATSTKKAPAKKTTKRPEHYVHFEDMIKKATEKGLVKPEEATKLSNLYKKNQKAARRQVRNLF
jgi:hypothetical protein